MNIGFCSLMVQYTAYKFKAGKNTFVKNLVSETSQNVTSVVDYLSGKTTRQYKEKLAKLNRQYEMLQRNLNSSLAFSPEYIDILR